MRQVGKTVVRTATKKHNCIKCGHKINKGDQYERTVVADKGVIDTIKLCIPCQEKMDKDFFEEKLTRKVDIPF